MPDWDWMLISTGMIAFFNMVTAVAVVVAIIVALLQLNKLRQQISLSALDRIFQDIESSSSEKDKRIIYTYNKDVAPSPEVRAAALRLMNSLNRIGFLIVDRRLITVDRAFAQFFGVTAIRIWYKLDGFVDKERARRNEDTYMRFFEELIRRCEHKLPHYKAEYFRDDE